MPSCAARVAELGAMAERAATRRRPGRPRLPPERQLRRIVTTRLTDREATALYDWAAQTCCSVPRLLRDVCRKILASARAS